MRFRGTTCLSELRESRDTTNADALAAMAECAVGAGQSGPEANATRWSSTSALESRPGGGRIGPRARDDQAPGVRLLDRAAHRGRGWEHARRGAAHAQRAGGARQGAARPRRHLPPSRAVRTAASWNPTTSSTGPTGARRTRTTSSGSAAGTTGSCTRAAIRWSGCDRARCASRIGSGACLRDSREGRRRVMCGALPATDSVLQAGSGSGWTSRWRSTASSPRSAGPTSSSSSSPSSFRALFPDHDRDLGTRGRGGPGRLLLLDHLADAASSWRSSSC